MDDEERQRPAVGLAQTIAMQAIELPAVNARSSSSVR